MARSEDAMSASTSLDYLVAMLRHELGEDAILVDAASRDYYANDLFWQPGVLPEAIALPSTQQQTATAIRRICDAGFAVVPRGGGMSYSKGYLPATAGAIVVDATRLNRIVEVNVADRYMTAEAGCTWAEVNAALDGTGMRIGSWGPLSGRNATIGGALAQNCAFYGSALHGTVSDSVIGLSVVLADGTLVTTGSGGRRRTTPFTRDGGPDMTGLFVGDNGALGFKVAATFRLAPRPAHVGYLSFGFSSVASLARAQIEISLLEAISEGFGMDCTKIGLSSTFVKPETRNDGHVPDTPVFAESESLASHAFTLHLVVEGKTSSALESSMDEARAIGHRHGVEIGNAVPIGLRAQPFGPLRGVLGRNGERWAPVHGLFPLSAAIEVCSANEAYLASKADLMREHGVVCSVLTMTVGAAFFLEPSFYWFDEITPLHARALGDEVVQSWALRPANERARQAVIMLRRDAQDLYAGLGGISWQVARDYPFREIMKPETYALLSSMKRTVDPNGLMNPGALGLG